MRFANLIASEQDIKEYLDYRLDLYNREDIAFHDEIDILGFFSTVISPYNPKTKIKERHLLVTGKI